MKLFDRSFLQSSVTRHIALHDDSILVDPNRFSIGTLVVGRVIRTSEQYGHLETTNSTMHKLSYDDVVIGALGTRSALRGHTGQLPKKLSIGTELSLLNIGGVIGELSSSSSSVGKPVQLEILGAISSPTTGLLNISQSPISPSKTLCTLPPVIVISGSCMHAGKTEATCATIRYLAKQSLSCVALKLTGVGAQKDLNKMLDSGAMAAYSFVDAGIPSTCNVPVVNTAKGCLNYAARLNPDVIVIELGDGLLGEYGVLSLLNEPQIKKAVSTLIFSAADPVGAWGGIEILKSRGYSVDIVTGPCTDNQAGQDSIHHHCGVPAINAQMYPDAFGRAITESIFQLHRKKVGA